ncbi:carboxylesterase/lipase family protein [Dactylosporangium sucinum]|uniref:Carboxylic ester hydrolase n=1 Tax=Dactylosporangium sucinum TaxID=1424081 RepID=A0A917X613_9ACTN|nr:carboxylesterase family protein [Dactylosporangium sucinum]GGM84972.1 carboxylesterase [Dactylosporangium sucinum]
MLNAVHSPCGPVNGRIEDGVAVFRGIPFAQPPVGPFPIAPPVAAPPPDASRFGPISIQDPDPLIQAVPPIERNFFHEGAVTGKDCLTQNLWSPDVHGAVPVLVWIHGGAFQFGSGTGEWNAGASLARAHGIVIVTVNYRLGALGGFYLGDLDPGRSNLALQDQTCALRWVAANISAFGGDPGRVTVGGQSAGAMSTVALLAAPAARGLFHRAVDQSGHAAVFPSLEAARAGTARVLAGLRIDPDGDVLTELRIPAVQRGLGLVPVTPLVRDGVILDSDPVAAIRRGDAAGVDLMIGTTVVESRLFEVTGWSTAPASLDEVLDGLLIDADAWAEAKALYERLPGGPADLAYRALTDHDWTEPARAVADAQTRAGGCVFRYLFAWPSSARGGRVGSGHLVDRPFLLGNLDAPGVDALLGSLNQAAVELGAAVSTALARFVTDGDPGGGALGPWDPYTPTARATMLIDTVPGQAPDPDGRCVDFWEAHHAVAIQPMAALVAGT